MKNFIPTVLYHSKLIKLSQVVRNEIESQSRNQSIDKDNLKNIEQSISQIGLKTPIAVELIYTDDHDEDRSKYKLRDGCHRFAAYENLQGMHKNTADFDQIKCVVYKKHTGTHATSDWLQWQHQENEHLEKACRKNSFEDSIVTAYKLLKSGYLDKEAAELVAKNNWDSPLVDKVLMDWFKDNCKGLSEAEREDLITRVHLEGEHLRKSKLKRYSRTELKKILVKNYGIEEKQRLPAKATNANTTVWVASEQNFWTTVLSPVFRVFDEGAKTTRNDIIFHCRKGSIDHIDKRREKIKEMVDIINDWFSKNITAFKHVKVIDDVKVLGQKLAKEYGEKDGEFI